jgi:hypothetical protein
VVVHAVPELRIVPDDFWAAVRQRQADLDRRTPSPTAPGTRAPFWSQQRPRYLFSGLMRCGACGGGFSKVSAQHFGCSTAREKGTTLCANRLTVRRDTLEAAVLGALRGRLMDPELFAAFVAAFTAEWNRLQAEAAAGRDAKRQELERIGRQIGRLVDAIAKGAPTASLRDRLAALERRKGENSRPSWPAARPPPRACTRASPRSTAGGSPSWPTRGGRRGRGRGARAGAWPGGGDPAGAEAGRLRIEVRGELYQSP